MKAVNTNYMRLKEELEEKELETQGTQAALGMNFLTFAGYITSSRQNMLSNHLRAMVNLAKPEFARVATNNENLVGKYSDGYRKAENDLKIVYKIPRFSYMPEHLYTLIVYDTKKDFYFMFNKENIEDLTEKYGYEYDNTYIENKNVGDIIMGGDVYKKSKSYDEYMNYGFGINVPMCYQINNRTIEDAIEVSESLAKRMESIECETISIPVNDNDYFGNLYGDKNNYKGLPNIGEKVVNHVLCCKKRRFKNQEMHDMKESNLSKIDFTSDKLYYATGIVEDIIIYCNKPIDEIPDTPLNTQNVKNYLIEQERYFEELNAACKAVMSSGSEYHVDIDFWYKRSSQILSPEFKWRADDNIFSNMIIEVTVVNRVGLSKGSKITGRYGNKGVISKITPDREMPFTKDIFGNVKRCHMICNALGIPNRGNTYQWYEVPINRGGDAIVKYCKHHKLDVKEGMKVVFDFISIFNVKQHAKMKEDYNKYSMMQKKDMYEDILENGIYVIMDNLYEDKPVFFKLMDMYEKFPWIRKEKAYIHRWGRDIPIMTDTVVGEQYMIKLKQTSKKGFSARSLSGVGIDSLPSKTNKLKKNEELYSKTPIRMGTQENINLTISAGTELFHDLCKVYRTSPIARRQFGAELITKEGEIENVDKYNKYESINVLILKALFKALGIGIEFSDEYEHINLFDNTTQEFETEDGGLFIGTEEDYEIEKIRKQLDESYERGDDFFIGSPDEYNQMLDKLAFDTFYKMNGWDEFIDECWDRRNN